MKKRFLAFLLLPLMITACGGKTSKSYEEIDSNSYQTGTISRVQHVGDIAAFDLTGPENGFSTGEGFTFTWQAADNADSYQLEIASTPTFISDDQDEVYVKESNLYQNRFNLTYVLPKKDILYYWRVTAVNKNKTKKCNSVRNFFYESAKIDEIPIVIEDEQDWTLHKEGSYADIKIDRSDFFGNGQNSLAIIFDKEHTNQGIPSSDGWIVITKTEDRELYGTDSFYFNFYYSGHDATVLVRVLDYDGEYWHKQVQISNNAKQTILMRYEDFELRTAGTNINNRVFDWEHIRYFEIVFERTFGDGICLFSNIKAVKYDNYKDMFIQKMDFRSTPMSEWTYENFNFDKTISEDGSELTLTYLKKDDTNPNGFNGYGFQNVNVYKYFVQGDAIRMKVKYTGTSSNAMFYFRILEEDNDRWQFKLSFSYLLKDDYKELIVPLKAFQRTDYMTGDGAKQFYYIQKFNFGLADNYATGSISIKDLEVIKIDDVVDNRVRTVSADGCIEDLDNYNVYTEIYYYWDQSVVNKDEAMKLDNTHKAGGSRNPYCAEFDYKADMEMAVYQLNMNSSAAVGKNALSLWLKDASVKFDDPAVAYLDDNDVASELTIQLTMDSGEWYRYVINKVGKEWNNYTILFSDFTLNNGNDLFDEPNPLSSEHICHMALGFKYLYYDQNGKHHPTYAIANPVYLDEIYFVNATSSSVVELSGTIKPDEGNTGYTTIDTFESYQTNEDIFDYWFYQTDLDYNSMTLGTDVSSVGGSKSMKMHYYSYNSVSYHRTTLFAKSVAAKGICLDIKGDGKATVYLNLNWRNGTSLLKMRYTITNLPNTWTHYEIGLSLFKAEGSTKTMTSSNVKDIETISFGIVNQTYQASDIYVDNMRMSNNMTYTTETRTAL